VGGNDSVLDGGLDDTLTAFRMCDRQHWRRPGAQHDARRRRRPAGSVRQNDPRSWAVLVDHVVDVGGGPIDSIADLVEDPATQLVVATPDLLA
jgi:hypothetical protein